MANKTPKNNQRPDRAGNRKSGNSPELSPEEKRKQLAIEYGLKDSTKAFIDELLADPKQDIGDAYLKTHKTLSKRNASTAGSKLLKKPAVIGYRANAVGKAKRRIVQLVESENESISLKAAQDVIDRNEGKAVQKTENTSKVVTVKLDLSGVKIGAHYIQPDQSAPIQLQP